MKATYKVLIRKCEDSQMAKVIADEVARWSGCAPETVYGAITQKSICIRKECSEEEANALRNQFGGIGAEVAIVPVNTEAVAAVTPVSAAAQAAAVRSDDDDDDEEPGRVLSDAEYAEMCKQRGDIFYMERDSRLRNMELVSLILAIGVGVLFSVIQLAEIATDFFEKMPEERKIVLVDSEKIDAILKNKEEEEKKKIEEEKKSDIKKLKPTNSQGVSAQKGGGDPRARVTQKGVLGIVSGQIKGKTLASADIFGKGGFATDIDAILSGVGGLKAGGDGGVGRKGVAGIGYGKGYGPGFGGGPGGSFIDGLMNSGSGTGLDIKKKTTDLKISLPQGGGSVLTGGRSRASIQRVVMQNMQALRYAYNRRLSQKPGLAGKITVKFAIDEFGTVTFASIVESTMGDSELEQTVLSRVKSWNFDKIDRPGDVTEVTYPFVFSN